MKYELSCPYNCSLRPGTMFGDKASQMLANGWTYRNIQAEAKKFEYIVQLPTLVRHRKHIVITEGEPEVREKKTNIAILEDIIQKGSENAKNWRPTIGDTMKAMDMWFRLTQGNPFDELLNAMASASIEEEEEASVENPGALALSDEQEVLIDDSK